MDIRNICKKIDVDGIRAKLPTIPALPLSQLKIPKLKSRKIFRSSHEDINAKRDTRVSSAPPPNVSTSEFINHTPQRISTISSLVNHNGDGGDGIDSIKDKHRGTYRSAYSVDDDYPIATTSAHFERRLSKPISPVRPPPGLAACNDNETEAKTNLSLLDKLQKGYKDITEFRFKHIFAKKTVVRKDVIQVDNYVQNYNEDRMREEHEQDRRDCEIADNYRFKFKISRQRSGHTNSLTSNESTEATRKHLQQSSNRGIHESADESGMEESPPRRIPTDDVRTITRTRRNALTQNSLTEDDDQSPTIERRPVQKRLRRDVITVHNHDESDMDENVEEINRNNIPTSRTKSNTLTSIKSNIQRFQKSIKRSHSVEKANESGEDDKKQPKTSTTEKIAARLRKFKSQENIEGETTTNNRGDTMQPVQTITTKLKTWKKSFKRQPSETVQQTDDETSPTKQTNSNKIMKKLKDMRSKKQPESDDHEQDTNEDDPAVKKVNTFEDRFTQARQRTLKKMQQMSFFHKSQENVGKDSATSKENAKELKQNQKHKSSTRRSSLDADESEYEEDDIEEIIQRHEYSGMPKTMWSTNPILTESIESDDCEFPRVVIHQDHSDAFESTLIIAVTRSAMTSPLSSPILEHAEELKITEISLQDETPIINSKTSDTNIKSKQLSHATSPLPSNVTVSLQQTSSNYITEDNAVWTSTNNNVQIATEIDQPWKVQSMYKEKLYKTKSIDLFDNGKKGGLCTAFEDFDDELKNAPIVRIRPCNLDSFENESEEMEETDDDGSLHKKQIMNKVHINDATSPTKCIQLQPSCENHTPQIGNSRESLITNADRYGECDTDDDMNRPPSTSPSPPPSSPPPAPPSSLQDRLIPDSLPSPSQSPSPSLSPPRTAAPELPRNPPPTVPQRIVSSSPPAHCIAVTPLPLSKPPDILPPPPRVPERTTSMNRISKPLVKTSSLRLTFDEQVHPSDVGKVNKLITRFEHPKSRQRPRVIPRFHRSESADLTDDEDNHELIIYESNEDRVLTTKEDIQNANVIQQRDQSNTPTPPTIHTTIQKPQCIGNTIHSKIDVCAKSVPSITTTAIATSTPTSMPIATNDQIVINSPSGNQQSQYNIEPTTSINIPKISLVTDKNSNYSCASSEYGSPPEYPSSLIGSTESTPINDRRRHHPPSQQTAHLDTLTVNRRSRRSMTRDDERFFSFDSDEENSYYSISSTGSSRYIVEL